MCMCRHAANAHTSRGNCVICGCQRLRPRVLGEPTPELVALRASLAELEGTSQSTEIEIAMRALQLRVDRLERTVVVSRDNFAAFKDVQIRRRPDWPAVFSTNNWEDLWPFATRGHTPEDDRMNVRGIIPVLDHVRDVYLNDRPQGGRFFIDESGAQWKDEDLSVYQIVYFDIEDI